MIEIGSKKNKYTYNAYHIVKSFFPGEEIIQKVDEKQEPLVAVRLPGGSCFSLAPEEIHIDAAGFGTEEAAYGRRRSPWSSWSRALQRKRRRPL